jgi:hypothetical protein
VALLEPLQGSDAPGGIALDLVRLEDRDPHGQQRIRQRAEQLLNP